MIDRDGRLRRLWLPPVLMPRPHIDEHRRRRPRTSTAMSSDERTTSVRRTVECRRRSRGLTARDTFVRPGGDRRWVRGSRRRPGGAPARASALIVQDGPRRAATARSPDACRRRRCWPQRRRAPGSTRRWRGCIAPSSGSPRPRMPAPSARGHRCDRRVRPVHVPTTIDVDGVTIRSKRFVVATGARPSVPPIPGLRGGVAADEREPLRPAVSSGVDDRARWRADRLRDGPCLRPPRHPGHAGRGDGSDLASGGAGRVVGDRRRVDQRRRRRPCRRPGRDTSIGCPAAGCA